MDGIEYSAAGIRKILQQLFPKRRLVLSQFTFFNQVGVAKASGDTFSRGRRCYRLEDILSIACVLALKEEGIPLKNIGAVPSLVQQHCDEIFSIGPNSRLFGYGDIISLQLPTVEAPNEALDEFLNNFSSDQPRLFWSFDIGILAWQLRDIASGIFTQEMQIAA